MTSSISIIAPTYSALTKEECKIDSYVTSFNHYVTIYPPDMSLADALGNVDDFYFIAYSRLTNFATIFREFLQFLDHEDFFTNFDPLG